MEILKKGQVVLVKHGYNSITCRKFELLYSFGYYEDDKAICYTYGKRYGGRKVIFNINDVKICNELYKYLFAV